MAEVIRYVDTDVVGGLGNGSSWANAHPTLADWETDNQTDLDTANNWMHVYVRGAANDTAEVSINGWTTSATDYILIETTSDSTGKHAGVWDDGKYSLVVALTYYACGIEESYVRIVGLQIKSTAAVYSLYTIGTDTRISNCIIVGTHADWHSIWMQNGGSATAWNCIFYHSGAEFNCNGVYTYDACTLNLYSCLVTHTSVAIRNYSSQSTINVYNSVVFNNAVGGDFQNTITCDYCASDDADATTYTNGVDFTSEETDWGNIFTDYANNDFRLKNYTGARCLIDKGASQSYGDPDIRGMARVTWDIGPFEAAPLSISASECVGSTGRLA